MRTWSRPTIGTLKSRELAVYIHAAARSGIMCIGGELR